MWDEIQSQEKDRIETDQGELPIFSIIEEAALYSSIMLDVPKIPPNDILTVVVNLIETNSLLILPHCITILDLDYLENLVKY